MDALSILKTKPHNQHYLTKYYSFILSCVKKNNFVEGLPYTENHHICPKSDDMFPEYGCLKSNPWNFAKLTYRQHIIAHILLYKTYNTESQLRSILFTIGQRHATKLNLKSVNTKLIESLKTELSNKRKGKFSRGYCKDGTPIVSETTKQKLSALKKQFYADPENRKRQSIATLGIKRNPSDKFRESALTRSDEHKSKLKNSIQSAWKNKKLKGETKRVKDGIYVTPIGNLSSIPEYASYCRNCDKKFNIHHLKNNPKLNSSVIGMTPRDLGLFYISKKDPLFEQYCVDLNQEHPPEPNHPLSLELNDYLLRKKFLQTQ